MTFDEMKKIAEARTKGKWFPTVAHFEGRGYRAVSTPTSVDEAEKNAEFIAMAANNWDRIIARLEALEGLAGNVRIMANNNWEKLLACAEFVRDISPAWLPEKVREKRHEILKELEAE